MLKKYIFVVTVLFLGAVVYTSFSKEEIASEIEEKAQSFPGYYSQWLYLKTAGSNVLPEMVNYQWDNNSSKRATSNALINVYEYGPNNIGGRIRALVVDWSNPNHLILGGASGGVFVSNDKGQSWRAINDQALSPSVTYMTQSPFQANIIYYCTGEASGNSADLIGAGVFKSTDGGNTFDQLPATDNTNFNQCWSIKCSPKDSNTLFVATHSSGLWRSTDAGANFTKVHTITAQINDLEVFPDGSVMFTVKGSGVYRSSTGNPASFTKVASINSSSSARGELAYCKNFPNVVYAAISGPDNSYNGVLKTFYKSSDGGKTFVQKTNPTGKVNFGFTWYAMCMAVNDNDSNDIFIAGVDGGGSTDGGNSWVSAKEMHADIHIAVNSGNTFYVGSDGGLSLYTWGNYSNYSSLNNGINITQFYAGDVSPHTIAVMAGAQDNGTKEGLNTNQSFGNVFGADGGWCFYHATLSPIKYYSIQNGVVYRSGVRISDNIPKSDSVKWFIHPYHVSKGQGDLVVYPADRNLYYSSTGGLIFKSLGKISTGRFFCATTTTDANPVVYSGGVSAFVVADSANNNNASLIDLRLTMPFAIRASTLNCITVVPGYRDRAYLAFSNISDSGRLFLVKNALSPNVEYVNISGNLPVGLPVNYVECDPYNPEQVIFAGTDYGVYVTEDGGTTWIKDTRFPSTVISSIKIHENNKDIYFFTHGRGIFKGMINNLGSSSIKDKKVASRISLYPVPASNYIQMAVNDGETGKFRILDYRGVTVLSGVINASIQQIPTSNLIEGNYILVYEANGYSEVKRFNILR